MAYRFIKTNVGLSILRRIPIRFPKPCTNVVFPAPKFPYRANTAARPLRFRRLNSRFASCAANSKVSGFL